MIEIEHITETALVISNDRNSIRVDCSTKEPMFAVRDLLTVCGYKWPDKWIRRCDKSCYRMEKRLHPVVTKAGVRKVEMFFTDAEMSRKIVKLAGGDYDDKMWAYNEVLSYRPGKKGQATTGRKDGQTSNISEALPRPTQMKMQGYENGNVSRLAPVSGLEDLNKKIDNLLYELIEIKRYVAEAGR